MLRAISIRERIMSQYEIDSHTILMLHCDGEHLSTQIPDVSVKGHVATSYGAVCIRADHKHFGTGSLHVPAVSESHVSLPPNDDWNFGMGDFTIDFWLWRDGDQPSWAGIITSATDTSVTWILGYRDAPANANKLRFYPGGVLQVAADVVVPDQQWVHVAVVRYGNTLTLYQDGISVGSLGCPGLSINSAGTGLAIGRVFTNADRYRMAGYLDEIRISKSVARWKSNFSPPTQPYGVPHTIEEECIMVREEYRYPETTEAGWNLTSSPSQLNHLCLQDYLPGQADDDTSYVYTTSATAKTDWYTHVPYALMDSVVIKKVRIGFRAKGEVAGLTAQAMWMMGGQQYGTPVTTLTDEWTDYYTDFELNPDGNVPWTAWAINNVSNILVLTLIGDGTHKAMCTQIYFKVIYEPVMVHDTILFRFTNGGSEIADEAEDWAVMPCDGAVVEWTLLSTDRTEGSIVIDVLKTNYNTLIELSEYCIEVGQTEMQDHIIAQSSDVSSWDPLTQGDILIARVDSCTDITNCLLALKIRR